MPQKKFTKSVKVGGIVISPDELNQMAKDFRQFVKNANRRKEPAIFYYRVESVNQMGTTRKINIWTVQHGDILRMNFDLAALGGYKIDKQDRIIIHQYADELIRSIFYAIGLSLYRLVLSTGGSVSAYAVVAI